MILYFFIVNILSGILFSYDKYSARRNKKRIPELTLHFFELLGGAPVNVVLMYAIHHKNKKVSYWIWTWGMLILWIYIIKFV
jgi:uncharacterized membrane protein YsdA (DUF1294 family)